jgi:hypothetical protein
LPRRREAPSCSWKHPGGRASCQLAGARSYKADGKPTASDQVTFEQVLIDAGVPAEKRAGLLAEAD